jgi:hypothetical protein
MKKYIQRILHILIIILNIGLFINNYTYSEKIPFPKEEASMLLKTAWKPVMEFDRNKVLDKRKNFFYPPQNIQSKGDFIEIFHASMSERMAEDFYEDFIEEKPNGDMIAKEGIFFPSIYGKDSHIIKAYIKKRKNLKGDIIKEELVIKEKGMIDDTEEYKRTNYFKKDKNGRWVFYVYEGNGWYCFATGNNGSKTRL